MFIILLIPILLCFASASTDNSTSSCLRLTVNIVNLSIDFTGNLSGVPNSKSGISTLLDAISNASNLFLSFAILLSSVSSNTPEVIFKIMKSTAKLNADDPIRTKHAIDHYSKYIDINKIIT